MERTSFPLPCPQFQSFGKLNNRFPRNSNTRHPRRALEDGHDVQGRKRVRKGVLRLTFFFL